ncbi:MAG: hypothetical protein WDA07_02765 [Leucobacter sp.]
MSENMADDLVALLKSRGWSKVEENPGGSDLWAYEAPGTGGSVAAETDEREAVAHGSEMYVPSSVTLGSFLWSDLLERIAIAHEEPLVRVERAVELVRYDVTRFRVDGRQTVPLEAGATVIGSAFGMLRAAATAARRTRQMIGSSYSKLGDEIVREAKLAHTEDGSFVFPVVLKVSPPAPENHEPLDGVSYESAPPESPERRVTRTLAQAMAAFDKHVLQPGREPQSLALDQVVIAGGTKELLAHVNRALGEPDVSWFETGFSWAPVETVDKDAPSAVMIPADAEARELVARSVKLLSSPKKNPLQVVTGPIIHISHAPGELFGEIAIQTPLQGSSRLGRIEVQVRREQLSDIHDWMNTAKTVVVQGVVERSPGKPARIRGISEPRPLEETMLFTQNESTL